MLSRRAALALAPVAVLAATLPAHAADAPDALGEGQPVRPALPAAAYVKQLRANRAPALADLRRRIDAGDFTGVSLALFVSPFDDLRQACFFLPWAVVTTDEPAGVALQEKYIALRATWKGIDDAALSAARYQADAEDVSAAVAAFESALEALEAAIPPALAQT